MNWQTIIQFAMSFLPTILPAGEQWLTHLLSAVIAYDPNTVKWLQGALNSYLGTNLLVDGIYGPKTKSAVLQAEERLGIAANGALSNLLILGLEAALRALPKT